MEPGIKNLENQQKEPGTCNLKRGTWWNLVFKTWKLVEALQKIQEKQKEIELLPQTQTL